MTILKFLETGARSAALFLLLTCGIALAAEDGCQSSGDSGFELLEGTEFPYVNGIEVSADDEGIYVVSSTLFTVIASRMFQ